LIASLRAKNAAKLFAQISSHRINPPDALGIVDGAVVEDIVLMVVLRLAPRGKAKPWAPTRLTAIAPFLTLDCLHSPQCNLWLDGT
jgi:hypothetical protein